MLSFLVGRIPNASQIRGRLIEPFVGGGAVFFGTRPRRALLGDLNAELIDLYEGIRENPKRVWTLYRSYPSTKVAYKQVRRLNTTSLTKVQRAARSLYLNRTCFKGMWRHNKDGQFNIGYGGQDRRWAIMRKDLVAVAKLLRRATLKCADFEKLISKATRRDFVFLDPPYRPGERDQVNAHYAGSQFSFDDHRRLAKALRKADRRGVRWGMTISDHPAIRKLYRGHHVEPIRVGTGGQIGVMVKRSGEVLIKNVRSA